MTHHNDCHRQFHFSFVYSHYLKGGGNDLCFSIQRRKRYRKPGYRTLCAGTFKLFCSAFFSSRRRRRRRRLFTSTQTPLLPNPPSHFLASPPPHPLAPRLSLGVAVRVHPIFFRSFFLFLFFFFFPSSPFIWTNFAVLPPTVCSHVYSYHRLGLLIAVISCTALYRSSQPLCGDAGRTLPFFTSLPKRRR